MCIRDSSWAASGNVPFFQYMGFYDLLCCDLRNIALWKSETLFCWFFYKPGTEMECGDVYKRQTYEDAAGNSYEESTEFESEIKEAKIQSLKIEDDQEETNSWWYSVIAVIAVLLVSVLSLIHISVSPILSAFISSSRNCSFGKLPFISIG